MSLLISELSPLSCQQQEAAMREEFRKMDSTLSYRTRILYRRVCFDAVKIISTSDPVLLAQVVEKLNPKTDRLGIAPLSIEEVPSLVENGICYGACRSLLARCSLGQSMIEAAQSLNSDAALILVMQMHQKSYFPAKLEKRIQDFEKIKSFHLETMKMQSDFFFKWVGCCRRRKFQYCKEYISRIDIKINKYKNRLVLLRDSPHITECFAFGSTKEYRSAFKRVMSHHSEQTTVRGWIHIPKHVMVFECGPQGFFLFDSGYEPGLYSFPKRSLLIRAIEAFAKTMLFEEIAKAPLETLQKMQTTFLIDAY